MPLEIAKALITQVSLAHYTEPELIFPRLAERDSPGIIAELSRGLQRQGVIQDVLPFYQAALNRELLHESALDCGIAVPHVRLPTNRRLCFAFGRTAEPVAWGSSSAWRVEFVFLLAVPACDAGAYLHLLSGIARLTQQPETIGQIRAAKCQAELLEALQGVVVPRSKA